MTGVGQPKSTRLTSEVKMDTITLPKRTREGSYTPEDVTNAIAAVDALEDDRAAVVVLRDANTENGARNRARLLATAMHGESGKFYSAHAVEGEDGKWIGAVSLRATQEPREQPDRPEDAPTLRDLRAAARYLEIKGRSKMDYAELAAAVEGASDDPLNAWKGYGAPTEDESAEDESAE